MKIHTKNSQRYRAVAPIAITLGLILAASQVQAKPIDAGFAEAVYTAETGWPHICDDQGTATGTFRLSDEMAFPRNEEVAVVLPEELPSPSISYFDDFFDQANWDVVSQAGFYLVPVRAQGMAQIVKDVDATNVQLSYDRASREITVSFDYYEPGAYCGYKGGYGFKLIINHELWTDDGNVRFALDPARRELVVEPFLALDRIDVHAVSAGRQFNRALTLAEDGNYHWPIAPNVMPEDGLQAFFNYDIEGWGHDTPTTSWPLDNVAAAITTGLYKVVMGGPKAITINSRQEGYTYYVHYRVNSGPVLNYPAGQIIGYGQVVYTGVFVYANPDDTVEWNLTILEDGIAYDTAWASATY